MTREGADDSGSQDLPDLEGLVIPDDLSSLFGDASATGQEVAGHSPDGETAIEEEALPRYINTTAVVLTAVKQAKVLANLLALAGIEAAVVPSAKGAIAVRYVEQLESEADPAEFLSGFPREAEALGAALSVAARSETVLLAARVSSIDGEVTGQVRARRYRGGQIVNEPPPGLVLAQADAVAERLLIGLIQAPEVAGYISSADLSSKNGRGFFGRKRREADDA